MFLFHTLFRSLPGRIFWENLLKDKYHVFLSNLLQRVFVLIIDCPVFCFANFIVEIWLSPFKWKVTWLLYGPHVIVHCYTHIINAPWASLKIYDCNFFFAWKKLTMIFRTVIVSCEALISSSHWEMMCAWFQVFEWHNFCCKITLKIGCFSIIQYRWSEWKISQ